MNIKSQKPLTFAMLWRWCQDSREVSHFGDAITSLVKEMAELDQSPRGWQLAAETIGDDSNQQQKKAIDKAIPPPPPPLDFVRRQNGHLLLNPAFLQQTLGAAQAGGGRKAQFVGQCNVADAGIGLQSSQQLQVCGV